MSVKKGSLTRKILRVLSKERSGLSSRIVFKKLEDYDSYNSLCVTLCAMVKRNRIRIDGKVECSTCGHPFTFYRITESGRIKLAEDET